MLLSEYQIPFWDGNTIIDQLAFDSYTVVLLDIKGFPGGGLPTVGVNNQLAIENKTNRILWVQGKPKSYSPEFGSYYSQMQLRGAVLFAWYGSVLCQIDPSTGTVLSEQFTW